MPLYCNKLKFLILLGAMLLVPSMIHAGTKPLVVFSNPAAQDDPFFGLMTDFMQAAANDLGFDLVIYYGNRNHVIIDENIKTIFKGVPLPDYLVGMNARDSGKITLDMAEKHGVKTIFINQSFLGDDREAMGKPGEKYKQWLFEYLPDDSHAGHLLATTLIAKAQELGLKDDEGLINMVAISGHEQSFASILRETGLKRATEAMPDVRLLQISHAGWKRDKARIQAKRLLERYPKTTILWSASDLMGLGIADGLRDSGKMPGKDVLIGGVDWANFALDMVADGEFTTTIGGHFMDGAWALVMLYDHINGVDVPASGKSTFSSITSENVEIFRKHFSNENWEQIDFRQFSKHLNPDMKEYDFNLDAILRQFPAPKTKQKTDSARSVSTSAT